MTCGLEEVWQWVPVMVYGDGQLSRERASRLTYLKQSTPRKPNLTLIEHTTLNPQLTLPFVSFTASSKVHSDLLVGLESAKTMGRSLRAAMVCSTSLSNALAMVLTPMIPVGFRAFTASMKVLTCSVVG